MADKVNIREYYNSMDIVTPTQYNLIKSLKIDGPLTRKDFVNQLNIPRTTIYDNLVKLQKRRVVEKVIRNNGKRGRPLVFWKLK